MLREEESTHLSFPSVFSKQIKPQSCQPVVQGTALWSAKSYLFLFQPCHRKWVWKCWMRLESPFLPPYSAVRRNPWCSSFCWGCLSSRGLNSKNGCSQISVNISETFFVKVLPFDLVLNMKVEGLLHLKG